VASRRGPGSSQPFEGGYAQIELIQKIKHVIRRPGPVSPTNGDLPKDTSPGQLIQCEASRFLGDTEQLGRRRYRQQRMS